MTNTTTSALGSREKVSVCISFALLILSLDVVQACAQWPYPWPDSSNLPAGATQSGNVFPGGNLWGGNKLYTPSNLPQRYLSWSFGEPCDGLPNIHGPLDPGMATYRDMHGTRIIGYDMYNLDGIPIGQSNSLPINASDSRWNPHRNGYVGEQFASDIPNSSSGAAMIGSHAMAVFHVKNPGNNNPNTVTYAWLSFNYLGNYFDLENADDTVPPAIAAFGPGCVMNGSYFAPAETASAKWGYYGFAVTFTNNSDSETFAIGNISNGDMWLDTLQIATVCTPEPSTWGLVALGGLVLIVSRRRRDTTGRS